MTTPTNKVGSYAPTNKVNGDAVTKQEALRALFDLETYFDPNTQYGVWAEKRAKKVRDYINNADDKSQQEGGWMPIEDYHEDFGDVAIVLFWGSELYGTYLSNPLCSDMPLNLHEMKGYFKLFDFGKLPTPPESEE